MTPEQVAAGLPKLQSTYAIIDVMRGRKALAKRLAKHGPVRVLTEATITERAPHYSKETQHLRAMNDRR